MNGPERSALCPVSASCISMAMMSSIDHFQFISFDSICAVSDSKDGIQYNEFNDECQQHPTEGSRENERIMYQVSVLIQISAYKHVNLVKLIRIGVSSLGIVVLGVVSVTACWLWNLVNGLSMC